MSIDSCCRKNHAGSNCILKLYFSGESLHVSVLCLHPLAPHLPPPHQMLHLCLVIYVIESHWQFSFCLLEKWECLVVRDITVSSTSGLMLIACFYKNKDPRQIAQASLDIAFCCIMHLYIMNDEL